MNDRGTCRSCGQPILWVVMESGKKMPVDAAQSADGNVFVFTAGGVLNGVVARKGEEVPNCARHKSHFATCTQPDLHRRVQARREAKRN